MRGVALAMVLTTACVGEIGGPAVSPPAGPRPSASPSARPSPSPTQTPQPVVLQPAGIRLLTVSQYAYTVQELVGDATIGGVGQWRSSIAAAQGGVALTAVEEYESVGRAIAQVIFGDAVRREALAGCVPAVQVADPCTLTFLAAFGRKAFRRSLTAEEMTRYTALAEGARSPVNPWRGLEIAVVALLQSPNFLYRVELGEPDPTDRTRVRFTSIEMATRLAYFLWNGPPDEALIRAAERGELLEDAPLRAQVRRMLEDPRGRRGIVAYFADLLNADNLLVLEKDPTWVPGFTPTVGPALREQLLRTVESVVFDGTGDYRDLFDTRQTFVNAELARLYDLDPAGLGRELTPVMLPASGPRAGILSLGAMMALHSGLANTSPTLRGKYVRNVLLCQKTPAPPPGVVATLPEPRPGELVTTRTLLSRHQTEPRCASCHGFMDPIGFALEAFDPIGKFRTTQNGLSIDTSGEIDGALFNDARGLGRALRDHPALLDCFTRNTYRYATGHIEAPGEEPVLSSIARASGHSVPNAFEAIAMSDGFRFAVPAEGL